MNEALLRGTLKLDEPMRKHVSWRAGGAADRYYIPADLEDLRSFVAAQHTDAALVFVGLGSNLLVRDGGFRGTIVALHAVLNTLRLDAGLVYADAGVASPKVARFAANHDLAGAEFLAGIPGTIGGALAMNAGCYGSETWQHVKRVKVLRRNGEIVERDPGAYEIGYRHVQLRHAPETDEYFVGAWFGFESGDGHASRLRIKELLSRRIASQPLQKPNAGSVFRNPDGDHAARLIESCGLKGTRIGGAEVSQKHANFIINTGFASAADIEALIELVTRTVAEQTGRTLLREVRIIGEERV